MSEERPDRAALTARQREKLRAMLREICPANAFYARKFAASGIEAKDIRTADDLRRLAFTTKDELCRDQEAHPPYGTRLTYPVERYLRMHQTSGTTRTPLRCLDTPDDWAWWMRCWDTIYAAAGLAAGDRAFVTSSFGPFVGFWAGFEGAVARGMTALPGGGMSSAARLRFLTENGATVVLATPSYALRLVEVARTEGIDLPGSAVRALIVAGEPGGSIPATRARIEHGWGAEVFDHAGMTEVGPVAFECQAHPGGIHFNEQECIVEVVKPNRGEPVHPGTEGELVLTNLGRWGAPLLRYRTGDVVRLDDRRCACGRWCVRADGGILGRVDDMVHVRGNNVFPGAIEGVLRAFDDVADYRAEVIESATGAELAIALEPTPEAAARADDLARQVTQTLQNTLHFRAEVRPVAPSTLPRFEGKGRRFIRRR